MRIRYKKYFWVAFVLAAIVFLLLNLVPIYWIGLSSITPMGDLFRGGWSRYLPLNITAENFRRVFTSLPYGRYFLNSVVVCFTSTLVSLFLALFASYAFARLQFRGKDLVFWFFLMSMMLPPVSTIIPIFRLFRSLGLLNTLGGLIIVFSSNLLPFTIWVVTSFFDQVPRELEEASLIDGATFWQTFFRILLPLMRPILSSVLIINFIAAWNDLIFPLVLSLRSAARLLPNGLVQAASLEPMMTPWENVSAMSVMMILPVVCIVLLFQKQIMSGLLAGALK